MGRRAVTLSDRPRRGAPQSRPEIEPLYPRLRASKRVPREQVLADQRRRLQGAMVEAVWRHGYERTTVDELVALAGVSTRALYDVYGSKLACFQATCQAVLEREASQIAGACAQGAGIVSWEQRIQRALEAFLAGIAERPRAARLALAETFALSVPPDPLIQRGEGVFERLLLEGLKAAPQDREPPRLLVVGVLHGLWSLVRRALLEGSEQQLRGVASVLLRWLLALCPAELEHPRLLELEGGGGRRPPTARRTPSRGAAQDARIHVLDCCASLAASEGYAALSWTRIARESRTSSERLHEMFESVEDCFSAAIELFSARALSRAMRAAGRAGDWPQSVYLAVDSFYRDAARDPVFARLCFLHVFHAGARAARRRGALIRSFAELLRARAPQGQAPEPLIAELIVGSVWGLAHQQIAHARSQRLPRLAPHATYLALAPVIGATEAIGAIERASAAIAANGGGR